MQNYKTSLLDQPTIFVEHAKNLFIISFIDLMIQINIKSHGSGHQPL